MYFLIVSLIISLNSGCFKEKQPEKVSYNSITEKVVSMVINKDIKQLLLHFTPDGVFLNEEGTSLIKTEEEFNKHDLSKYLFDTEYIHKKKRLFYTSDVQSFRDIFLNKSLKITDRYDNEINYIKYKGKYYNYSSFVVEDLSYKYSIFIYNSKDDFYIFGFSIDMN